MSTTTHGLREQLTRLMEERHVPGLQAVVLRDGAVVASETLGMANLEHDVAVTQESVFSINSMAKAFTGVALMQLVEAGDLDLDAPVSRYLDAVARGLAADHDPTARDSHLRAARDHGLRRGQLRRARRGRRGGGLGRRARRAHGVRARPRLQLRPDQLRPARQGHRPAEREAVRRLHHRAPVQSRRHDPHPLRQRPRPHPPPGRHLHEHQRRGRAHRQHRQEPPGLAAPAPHRSGTAQHRRRPGRVDVRARERRAALPGEPRHAVEPRFLRTTAAPVCGASGGSSSSDPRAWCRRRAVAGKPRSPAIQTG